MFKITQGKGFHVTFENGYTVSVQFGGANYCDNRNDEIGEAAYIASGKSGSSTAEVAVWDKNGEWRHPKSWGDVVKAYVTPAEVVKIMAWAQRQK